MPDLIFKEAEINNLKQFVNDVLPTKFGIPILNFIAQVEAEREKENEAKTDGPTNQKTKAK